MDNCETFQLQFIILKMSPDLGVIILIFISYVW